MWWLFSKIKSKERGKDFFIEKKNENLGKERKTNSNEVSSHYEISLVMKSYLWSDPEKGADFWLHRDSWQLFGPPSLHISLILSSRVLLSRSYFFSSVFFKENLGKINYDLNSKLVKLIWRRTTKKQVAYTKARA